MKKAKAISCSMKLYDKQFFHTIKLYAKHFFLKTNTKSFRFEFLCFNQNTTQGFLSQKSLVYNW